jgi:small subunit ribosomal protein S15e
MADVTEEVGAEGEFVKRKSNKQFFYRGFEVQNLVGISKSELLDLLHARARRKFIRGLKVGHLHLLKRLRKAKKAAVEERPAMVKTRLRDLVIVPEMVGSVVGVYNGKTYITVEIKPDMVGHYVGEFSITYRPVRHGKTGNNAKDGRLLPLV